MLGPHWIHLAPAGQKMQVHQTNDVEAIGYDVGVREVLVHQHGTLARQDARKAFPETSCRSRHSGSGDSSSSTLCPAA
jgi:hypothetical protein